MNYSCVKPTFSAIFGCVLAYHEIIEFCWYPTVLTPVVLFSASLAAGQSTTVLMSINFNDTTQPAQFQLCCKDKKYNVSITAPVGELLQPNTITENDFLNLQGN